MKTVCVDKGAIKHVISGSDIMLPGLISSGGSLPNDLKKEEIVAVKCENHEHVIAIGQLAEDSANL